MATPKYSRIVEEDGVAMTPIYPTIGADGNSSSSVAPSSAASSGEQPQLFYGQHQEQAPSVAASNVPLASAVPAAAPSGGEPAPAPVAGQPAIPFAVAIAVPQQGQPMVPVVPPAHTLESLKGIARSRRVEFSSCQYIREAWSFVRPNLCFFVLSGLMWFGIILVAHLAVAGIAYAIMGGGGHDDGYGEPVPGGDAIGADSERNNQWRGSPDYDDDDDDQHVRGGMWLMLFVQLLQEVLLFTPMTIGYFNAVFTALRTNSLLRFNMLFAAYRCPYFARVAGLTLLLMLLRTVGFYLFVLPGIWFCIVSIFALPLHFDNASVLTAGKAIALSSRVLTRNFCYFFGFLLLLVLMQFAGLLALGVGVLVTAPWAFVSLCYCYQHLIGINGVAVLAPVPAPAPAAAAAVATPVVAPVVTQVVIGAPVAAPSAQAPPAYTYDREI